MSKLREVERYSCRGCGHTPAVVANPAKNEWLFPPGMIYFLTIRQPNWAGAGSGEAEESRPVLGTGGPWELGN